MKRVCTNWNQAFPKGRMGLEFFPEFEMRAKNAAAEVIRVKTLAEAKNAIVDLIKHSGAKKVVAVECPLQRAADIHQAIQELGTELHSTPADIAANAATADIGISGVEFGVAETGSVCLDAYSIESRLVSTLPPIHVVFMNSNNIVPDIAAAFEIFSQVFERGYISLITGPSRTADIERVLTIGVHGPSRFVIIAVDEEITGGES